MPLFVKPVRKISVKNVADAMRDHFEGTPLDMTTDIGAGGNALPYRWRPMGFEYKGWSYVNERAIATQQTGFWFVGQSRHDLRTLSEESSGSEPMTRRHPTSPRSTPARTRFRSASGWATGIC